MPLASVIAPCPLTSVFAESILNSLASRAAALAANANSSSVMPGGMPRNSNGASEGCFRSSALLCFYEDAANAVAMDYRWNHHAARTLTIHEGMRAFPGCLRVVSIGRQSFPRSNSGKRLRCESSLNLQFVLPTLTPEIGRLALCSKASGGAPREVAGPGGSR
jgi:hypothetical protein